MVDESSNAASNNASNGMAPDNVHDALDRIAERVAALVRTVHTLRDENQALKVAVDQRDGENRLLRERLATARDRVESLIARMPAADH